MPLAYSVRRPLDIPAEAYNRDDIATIVVTGGSYGGRWILNALSTHEGSDPTKSLGEIETVEAPDQPDQAVDTAVVWVNDFCVKNGVKLAHFENKNSEYGPDEAPFFAAAIFLIDKQ